MEWFPNRYLGRSKPKADALVAMKSKIAARRVLDELAQPVTRTPEERRRTTARAGQRFTGFGSPPGRF